MAVSTTRSVGTGSAGAAPPAAGAAAGSAGVAADSVPAGSVPGEGEQAAANRLAARIGTQGRAFNRRMRTSPPSPPSHTAGSARQTSVRNVQLSSGWRTVTYRPLGCQRVAVASAIRGRHPAPKPGAEASPRLRRLDAESDIDCNFDYGAGARNTSTSRRPWLVLRTPCGTPEGATSRSPAVIGSSRPSSRK